MLKNINDIRLLYLMDQQQLQIAMLMMLYFGIKFGWNGFSLCAHIYVNDKCSIIFAENSFDLHIDMTLLSTIIIIYLICCARRGNLYFYKLINWTSTFIAAESLPGRTDVQCLHRWQKVLNPELFKGPWKKEVCLYLFYVFIINCRTVLLKHWTCM